MQSTLWPGGCWYTTATPSATTAHAQLSKPPEMTPSTFMSVPVDPAAAAETRVKLSAMLHRNIREALGKSARVVLSEKALQTGCQLVDEMLQCETVTLHVALQALGIVGSALYPEIEPIFP